jgi:hypothetical protein
MRVDLCGILMRVAITQRVIADIMGQSELELRNTQPVLPAQCRDGPLEPAALGVHRWIAGQGMK